MTTATDYLASSAQWDVRDRETNDHLTVTEVQARIDQLDGAATDAPVLTGERALELERQNTQLAHLAGQYAEQLVARDAENQRLQAELDALKAQADPLTAPWTPDTNPPTLWTEETLIAQWAAAHRDSYDTHTLIADSHRQEREAVDSLLDYTEQVTTHEPPDAWDDALRALTAPVEVDYSYRQTEAWTLAETVAGLAKQHDPGVYGELAPELLDDKHGFVPYDPPRTDVAGPPHRAHWPDPPDAREGLDKLKQRVPTAISAAPESTSATRSNGPDVATPRESRWVRVLRWLGGGAA